MPAVSRKGDQCSGHGNFPPRANDQGSENVFVNGIGAHRQGDHWPAHCAGDSCHESTTSGGSASVFVNGKPLARIGDAVGCGSVVSKGSKNVFAGG